MLNTKGQWNENVDQQHAQIIGNRVVEALKANEFDAMYVADRAAAAQHILGFCEPGKTVAFGGSMTITRDMGMVERVRQTGAIVIENAYGDEKEMFEARRRQLLSDIYLCSTNALTKSGWLVNIDGIGNRTNSMTFGPRKVFVVAGVNKIVPDLAAAWQRLEQVVCPKNMLRLGRKSPCAEIGQCVDCRLESRGCRIYTVLKRRPHLTDLTVIVVGEPLGY